MGKKPRISEMLDTLIIYHPVTLYVGPEDNCTIYGALFDTMKYKFLE